MSNLKQEWVPVEEQLPNQKDLVWVKIEGLDMAIPAIFYKSLDDGFYHYSLFYHTDVDTVYQKARIKNKWRMENVIAWLPMNDPAV